MGKINYFDWVIFNSYPFCAPLQPPRSTTLDTPFMDFAGDLLELLLLVLAGRHLIIVRHLGRKDGMRNCMGNNVHKWKIMTIKYNKWELTNSRGIIILNLEIQRQESWISWIDSCWGPNNDRGIFKIMVKG